MHGHAKVVQSLLAYGADTNATTADVRTTLLLLLLVLALPDNCLLVVANPEYLLSVYWTPVDSRHAQLHGNLSQQHCLLVEIPVCCTGLQLDKVP